MDRWWRNEQRSQMKVLIAIDSSPASARVLEEVAARPWPANTVFCVASAVEVGTLYRSAVCHRAG
jgi:hypothetical protein